MNLAKVQQFASLVLTCALILLVLVAGFYLVHIARATQETINQVRATAFEVKQFAKDERALLSSREFQQLQKQNLAVGAAAIGTIRLLNTTTIPAVTRAVNQFEASGRQIQTLTVNTDRAINQNLLVEVRHSLEEANLAVRQASGDIHGVLSEANKTLAATTDTVNSVNKLAQDENIPATLAEIRATAAEIRQSSANINESTQQVRDGAKEFPGIAKDLHQFTTAQSKATRLIILARLLPSLAELIKAVLP